MTFASTPARGVVRRWPWAANQAGVAVLARRSTTSIDPDVLASVADATYQAVVFDWDGSAVPDRHAGAAGLRARIEALCAAGVHIFVISGTDLGDVDGRLGARPSGSGRLHLCLQRGAEVFEVGPSGAELVWRRSATDGLTDRADSAHWAAGWLAERGITGSLVLVVGDAFGQVGRVGGSDLLLLVPQLARASVVSVGVEPGGVLSPVRHLGGGPDGLLALLDLQLARRRQRAVPWIDEDPAWTIPLPDDAPMRRAAEAMGALTNGSAGIRGAREEDGPDTTPLFVVNGLYSDGAAPRLLPGPVWTQLTIHDGGPDHRMLDLRTGMLVRATSGAAGVRSVRFVSAAHADAAALRAEGAASHLRAGVTFGPSVGGPPVERARRGDVRLARIAAGDSGGIGLAARGWQRVAGGKRVVERVVTWTADTRGVPDWDRVAGGLAAIDAMSFDALAAEHREAWARRWAESNVVIEGDPESELAARFAVFHLLAAAPDCGEAAVGARGLTGPAYGGHVFWDADVFVLPALAAMRPAAARAMLEYRIRRLPAARAAARRDGLGGARFPWESARDGDGCDPAQLPGPTRGTGPDPHRPARGAHRGRRRVGRLRVRRVDGRCGVPRRSRA